MIATSHARRGLRTCWQPARTEAPMDTSHLARNQAAMQRLTDLVGRLTDDDLARSLGGGWTIKAALAHLAFWDRYAVALLDDWSAHGFQPVASSPDHINAG